MLLLFFACGGGDSAPADTASSSDYPTCEFDFEATIQEGPDAGIALLGSLKLADLSTLAEGGAFGELEADGERYAVSASVDEDIELWFVLHDGSVIHGVGETPPALDACVGTEVEGSAEGPAEGDVGDWLAVGTRNLTCTLQCSCSTPESVDYACSAACALYGLDLSSAEGMACVETCSDNIPQGCTCESVPVNSGGVSTFFNPCE